ncbi:MAG TPA: hypothetical protein VN934_03575 [Candidatus Tumulicola sp.]|nr:hypothetical protein [Candidatus Tumulicola sp.]
MSFSHAEKAEILRGSFIRDLMAENGLPGNAHAALYHFRRAGLDLDWVLRAWLQRARLGKWNLPRAEDVALLDQVDAIVAEVAKLTFAPGDNELPWARPDAE